MLRTCVDIGLCNSTHTTESQCLRFLRLLLLGLPGRCQLDLTGILPLRDARIDTKIFRFSDECSGSALQKIANHDDCCMYTSTVCASMCERGAPINQAFSLFLDETRAHSLKARLRYFRTNYTSRLGSALRELACSGRCSTKWMKEETLLALLLVTIPKPAVVKAHRACYQDTLHTC
ncbi:hypothetical protein M441DRAFT_315436 [Trichoderma asperellum CBS 433.97]|uniref:Uncharacterized protein n=1 Tax=Trichoderma asperellum (strain ATCC 204424 / CBS 433.97 / NBRC 101777) TaxID=1042311 RepID=A0A2T3ZKM5_TRIA4|nr:hypothetical protein M441DRAFT_315436 [Trichoderma asperellum CBS 433.97]PTB45355.1 hypothetical protein M441DRAFT_315436 [Trichoderma asperellum CBS 433.97]